MEIRVVHAFIYLIQAILELITLLEDHTYPSKKKRKKNKNPKKQGGFQNFTLLSHKVWELLPEV